MMFKLPYYLLKFYDFSIVYSTTIKTERIQKLNQIDALLSEILVFKLIVIRKFQNVPCALGFEVEQSKIFGVSFRTCIII